jgi:alpha-amylase/alpha-mannosidase (GH57 family)
VDGGGRRRAVGRAGRDLEPPITEESYRPNGWAAVLDHDTVVDVVNNFAHLSFDVGPTLTSWLAREAPDVLARMVEGDRAGGGAIAQAYNHVILPLADEADVRIQVRWGLADFRHRFGREAAGMWLPRQR